MIDRRRLLLAARTAALFGPLAFGLGACGSDPPPPDTVAVVKLVAAPTLNPDINGRPSPVVVRLYQLTSTELLSNADFFQIFEQEKATLGPTMVDKQELIVQPGGIETINMAIQKTTKFVAAVVAYRNYEKAQWQASVPVQQLETTEINAELLSTIVQLSVRKSYPTPPPKNAMGGEPCAAPCLAGHDRIPLANAGERT